MPAPMSAAAHANSAVIILPTWLQVLSLDTHFDLGPRPALKASVAAPLTTVPAWFCGAKLLPPRLAAATIAWLWYN